ncbi:amino acid adenylation domain-containing protein, partial [Sphingomonas gei]
ADAGPRAILTHEAAREALDAARAGLAPAPTVLDLNETAPWTEQPSTSPDPASLGLTSRNLAYIIYTSGSTGTPKGVLVEHKGMAARLLGSQACLGPVAGDVMPNLASPAFDISLLELLLPLAAGGRSQLVASGDSRDVETLIRRTGSATVFHAVPSLMQTWCERLGTEADSLYPHLRLLLVGGEAVPLALLQRLSSLFPHAQVKELYGPTEAVMICTACELGETSSRTSIGRPLSNTRIYLLDGAMCPVPLGAVGEIYIGGAGVARGYLNRPELTAERFVASPFVAGDRLYRTGDLARYLPDGNIEFLGRNDHQVKIRGFRIELGEIEARLAEHADVAAAAVLARHDEAGDKRLVAYVVPAGHSPGDEQSRSAWIAALRAHLAGVLPDYMVPAAYVLLDALPLTPNGKLDRGVLPAPDGDAFARQAYEAPQGPVEQALAAIWSELLGVERISRHDNFFELGGHSLLVVHMFSRRLDRDINFEISKAFQTSDLKSLAEHCSFRATRTPPAAVSIRSSATQASIFFVPDGLGYYSYIFELAINMDTNTSIYALPWPHHSDKQFNTIESMAVWMIEMIKQVQPRGPYYLSGYSSGGILAYAITDRLLDMGESVSFLALIDVISPSITVHSDGKIKDLVAYISYVLPDNKEFKRRISGLDEDEIIERCLSRFNEREDEHLLDIILRFQQSIAFNEAVLQYAAPAVKMDNMDMYLFVSSSPKPKIYHNVELEPTLGWEEIVSPSCIKVVEVPGTHNTMLSDPNVAYLAKSMSLALLSV